MAFFQKNIGNFLDRLAVFCVFCHTYFNRWGRHPLSSKRSTWGQVRALFLDKNGVQGQIQEACSSWPIIHPEADIGHFECPNQGNQSYILPIDQGFFGADNASQVLLGQEDFSAFSEKNADCFDCAEVSRDDAPEGLLPWATNQEKGGLFGILRDQGDGACGLLLQKRIRTSWYL